MRDPERIDEFCEELKKMWQQVPDWRFGQLIVNALGEIQAKEKCDVFFVEDDKMLEDLKEVFATKFKMY